MGDVINLNKVRKERQRRRKKAKAAESRVRFGLAKGHRKADRKPDELDGKRLEDSPRSDPRDR